MIDNPTIFMNVAERFGVPVAFALIMVLLLVWFAKQHRDERNEWRDMMESESQLNRAALGELSKMVSNIAMSIAYLDGSSSKRKARK